MFRKLTLFGVVLTLIIIVLDSYIRLSGAEPALSNQSYSEVLKGSGHVYLAVASGLVVLSLCVFSWRQQQGRLAAMTASLILLLLVGLQAALGYLAKAVHAMPIVITTQVLLGMITVSGCFFGCIYALILQLLA